MHFVEQRSESPLTKPQKTLDDGKTETRFTFISGFCKAITFTPNGQDYFGIGGIITEFGAQIGNVHINSARGAGACGKPPDPQQNLLPA